MVEPRPVGTRKKTLHSTMSSCTSTAIIESKYCKLCRVIVVLICTGSPISAAQRTARSVQS